MNKQNIEVPEYITSKVDQEIAKLKKVLERTQESINNYEVLRKWQIEAYFNTEYKEQEEKELIRLGSVYRDILKKEQEDNAS